MSLLNSLFKAKPVEQAQAPKQQAQAPKPDAPIGEANNTVPNTTNTPTPAQPGAESPLADFANVWETKPTDTSNQQVINLNQDELNKLSSGMDFNSGISPEQIAAVAAGGEDSIPALQAMLNQVGKNAFSNALQGSAALANRASISTQEQINQALPNQLKNMQASDGLRADNANLNNPAVAPMVAMIEQQLSATYPNATAQELQSMTSNYLTQFSEAISPTKPKQDVNKLPADQDFSSFLN